MSLHNNHYRARKRRAWSGPHPSPIATPTRRRACLCGAAPIPWALDRPRTITASTAEATAKLNAALYRIAIVPQARIDLARKITEGKTPREARRALKRHLAADTDAG